MPQLKDLPLFKLVIDLSTDMDGMDFMGLVDYPAHGKAYQAFRKGTPRKRVEFKDHFNDDKRIVTGVAIATNLPIYRRDMDGFEYNAIFTKEDTLDIAQHLFKNGYMHNVNEMHDLNKEIKAVYLFESFFINDKKTNIPEAFADQNLQAGDWLVSYKVDDDAVWKKIKDGEFQGFSIEGWFEAVEVNLKKSTMKKSLMERLFGKKPVDKPVFDKENKGNYATATDVDGNILLWDGDLESAVADKTPLFVEVEDGEPVLAAAGDYSIDMDGAMTIVTVDEGGIITAVSAEEVEEELEEVEEAMEAMRADYKAQLTAQKTAFDTQLETIATSFDEFKTEFETYKEDVEKVLEKKGIKMKVLNPKSNSGFLSTKKKTA